MTNWTPTPDEELSNFISTFVPQPYRAQLYFHIGRMFAQMYADGLRMGRQPHVVTVVSILADTEPASDQTKVIGS